MESLEAAQRAWTVPHAVENRRAPNEASQLVAVSESGDATEKQNLFHRKQASDRQERAQIHADRPHPRTQPTTPH